MRTENSLEVRGLRVWYPRRRGVFSRVRGFVKAVDGVDFSVRRGETLGLVGESGSGKSTIARALFGLVKPTAGEIELRGRAAVTLSFLSELDKAVGQDRISFGLSDELVIVPRAPMPWEA